MSSISIIESKIKRLNSSIASLEKKRSDEMKKESDALKRITAAQKAIRRTKNQSTTSSKLKEIEREQKKFSDSKAKQADISKDIAKKNAELNKATADLNKQIQKEQKEVLQQQERQMQEIKHMQTTALDSITSSSGLEVEEQKEYDVFISHASEDKDPFVIDLVEALKKEGISIWYDSDDIAWGQSIRASIDKGLRNSKYGIVVLSPSYIKKYWTEYELNGILKKESSTGKQVILPIWHNITADQVSNYSYALADLLALNTAVNTIANIVDSVKKMTK